MTRSVTLNSFQGLKIRFRFQNDRYIRNRNFNPVYLIQSEQNIENRRLIYINSYFRDIAKIDDQTRESIIEELIIMANRGELPEDPVLFTEKVYSILEIRYPQIARRQGLGEAIKKNITTIYSFYRLIDTSQWGDNPPVRTRLDLPDRRAQDFLSQLDEVFFSDYVQNEPFKTELKDFLKNEVLEKGFVATDEVLKNFGNAWADSKDIQVRRIIDTSVSRVRNFAHIRQMKSANIAELEIMEILDRITCGFCREMDGRIVSIDTAHKIIDSALSMSAEQFQARYLTPAPTEQEAMGLSMEELIADGRLPPFHPLCRGRSRARFKQSLTQYEEEHGALPDIERHYDADYSEHGKKLTFIYMEKTEDGIKKHTSQETIVYSILNPLGKKVYFTKEAIQSHSDDEIAKKSISIAGTIIAGPNQIYLDKAKGNDTKIYLKHIRGINYGVETKRAGPELINIAFLWDGTIGEEWVKIWQH